MKFTRSTKLIIIITFCFLPLIFSKKEQITFNKLANPITFTYSNEEGKEKLTSTITYEVNFLSLGPNSLSVSQLIDDKKTKFTLMENQLAQLTQDKLSTYFTKEKNQYKPILTPMAESLPTLKTDNDEDVTFVFSEKDNKFYVKLVKESSKIIFGMEYKVLLNNNEINAQSKQYKELMVAALEFFFEMNGVSDKGKTKFLTDARKNAEKSSWEKFKQVTKTSICDANATKTLDKLYSDITTELLNHLCPPNSPEKKLRIKRNFK
jgi:hypothetical protein